ncbi:MAG TPA: efflux RND transporter periplasmic adaptor subunit [Polyangiales bacterium]|nr:efflux RND transporter periplasmic adaptor subunit [Polyangiales bacterium]
MTKSRKLRVAPLVALAIVATLLTMIAMRYKQAVAERAAIEQSNVAATAAETAKAAAGGSTSSDTVLRTTHGTVTSWQPSVGVAGTLSPVRQSGLNFKVPGRLTQVRVKLGDKVTAGQLLAALDSSDVAAQLKVANAQVHSAEVSLEIARDEENRSKALLAQGAISDAQHRSNAQRRELAQASLEAARAQAETVSAALDNTRLVAPFAGRVTQVPSAPGEIVSPQMPGTVLVRVEDTSALRFSGTLLVDDVKLVHVGSPIVLESGARGSITTILPTVDPQTRRVPFEAEIANDEKSGSAPLLAGVFARAAIVSEKAIDVVKLPAEALRPGSQDEVVLATADHHARVVRVTFSRAEDGSLLVREGVRAEETVVLGPSASVKTGDALGGN